MVNRERGDAQRGVQDESDYNWEDISDFTAGIYSYSRIVNTSPNVPAPRHAADPNQTWSCMVLPAGGLGPLPGIGATYNFTPSAFSGHQNYIVGLLVHDELANGNTEAFVIWESDNGVNHGWTAYSEILETTTFTGIVQATTTEPTGAGIFGSPYPQLTRMAHTNPTTTPGKPVIVFPNGGPASDTNAATGQLYAYPDPTTPGSFQAERLITGYPSGPFSSVSGQVLVHQNRVIVLQGINYTYATYGFNTNEQIAFTDPPNSDTFGNQQTVLVPEEPFGYGCGGSISAGELFLVKHRGGAVVMTGDIFAPSSVTLLPGVQPTGTIYGSGHSGMMGFVYCSLDNGAWVWNGSNTAQKISQQLDDNFFVPPEFSGAGGTPIMPSNNYVFFVRCIGDRIFFSGNWVYDMRTNSWWRYYPTKAQGGRDLFWINECNGPSIYCGRLSFDPGVSTDYLYRFDQGTPTSHYQWQSLPIRLNTDRMLDVRRIVVRASSNNANANGTVAVQIYSGTTLIGSATTPNGNIQAWPTMLRMPLGPASGAGTVPYATEDITVRLIADGAGGPAPNIHSVSIGWNKRSHAPTIGVSV